MRNRVAAIGALAATALAACGEAGGAAVDATDAERLRTVNVEVVEVTPRRFTTFVRLVGTVEAERDVTVSAEEGGRVEAILAEKGSRVRPGQPLLRLNGDVLRAQLDQAASQAALAEETWERQKQLWEQDSIGTEMAYLQARYNAETAKAQARVLAERVARTVVRAPIDGILDERPVEVGTMVAPGAPVVRILDVDTVKIVGGVPERYASEVGQGSEVEVTVDALGGRRFAGTVDFVGSAISGGSRTFQIEVVVPNPGLGIKPGMVANVQIARQALDSALVVPRPAVIRREQGYVVYVARETEQGWRAEARPVVPGGGRGEDLLIAEGLEPGEYVVVVGQQRIADGDALRVTGAGGRDPAAAEAAAEAAAGAADTADRGAPAGAAGNGGEGEG